MADFISGIQKIGPAYPLKPAQPTQKDREPGKRRKKQPQPGPDKGEEGNADDSTDNRTDDRTDDRDDNDNSQPTIDEHV